MTVRLRDAEIHASCESVDGGEPSGGLAGFQLVNHAPNAVRFVALDDLKGGRAVEVRVGLFEPGADGLGGNEVFQRDE